MAGIRKFFGEVDEKTNEVKGAFRFGAVTFYQYCLRHIEGFFQWREIKYHGEIVLWPHIMGKPLDYDKDLFGSNQ